MTKYQIAQLPMLSAITAAMMINTNGGPFFPPTAGGAAPGCIGG
jgi:hypothetical protein